MGGCYTSHQLAPDSSSDLLDAGNTHHLQNGLFVEWLRSAFLHFADEVFFKRNFRHVYPFAFLEPSNVTWWNLWQCNEGSTSVTEVSQANGVPCAGGVRFFASNFISDIVYRRRYH